MSNTASSVSADIPAQKPTDTEKLSEEEPPEKVPIVPPGEHSLATAELFFPLKSTSPVISGIPELILPLCGPNTLSQYKCQHPSCNPGFSKKQQLATMYTIITYMWPWSVCIAVLITPQKCIGIVHLLGSTMYRDTFRITCPSTQMTLFLPAIQWG